MNLSHRSILEIGLAQLVIYLGIYLWNDHVGTLLCTILGIIALAIAIISHMVEWIERSKVPQWYFKLIWMSALCPLIILVFVNLLNTWF